MISSKWTRFLSHILTIIVSIIALMPLYIWVNDLVLEGNDAANNTLQDAVNSCNFQYDYASLRHEESLTQEVERFVRHLNTTYTGCDRIELPGQPNKRGTAGPQDLRANSYVCLGGKAALKKSDCLVYTFGIRHPWVQFSELVEKELGCNVFVFEPAVDFIDHYHTIKIRFFNARLSDIDQDAKYHVPGENGWKYRKFLTILKELHDIDNPVDLVRLDVSLDLWKGMSTMLQDGSLFTFVRQLALEYNLNNKNATEVRQMFAISQWLNSQGFLIVHRQATKTSSTSYAVTYINSKMADSMSSTET